MIRYPNRAAIQLFIILSIAHQSFSLERVNPFNEEWKFYRGNEQDAHSTSFDDSTWRSIHLPHDYSIEDLSHQEGSLQIGPFSKESIGGASTGHVMGGTAWYRKHFTLDASTSGKEVRVLFDGIYMNSDIWINGHHLGNHPNGYTPISYSLTDFLHPPGKANILAVQVKNEGRNSRWYTGSGIYRNVSLIVTDPVHIDLWGTHVNTRTISQDLALIDTEVSLTNQTGNAISQSLTIKCLDPNGKTVASSTASVIINPGLQLRHSTTLEIPDPILWNLNQPTLYTMVVQLHTEQELRDETSLDFGIRSIEFSPDSGFLLNGEQVLLKGACVHHDHGPLGSAAFETAEFRRVQILKQHGFNAIRTAHNPPSKAFLDACDAIGMLVILELFDQWNTPKTPDDYSVYFDEWWEKDLESILKRDRNHPSIIIWSIGNEIHERADPCGLSTAKMLKEKILSLDTSRPVSQAICDFWDHSNRDWKDTAKAFEHMDVHGYNYGWMHYESDHLAYPNRIMVGMESYAKDALQNWSRVEKLPYVIGDFVWSGMDYFGESGIGHTRYGAEGSDTLQPWPWFNANCGDLNVLGDKKPQMFFRDVVWNQSELEILVHPPGGQPGEVVSKWGWPTQIKSWNWEGYEGKPIKVSVYSRGEQVRLELNGKPIGVEPISEDNHLTAVFFLNYEPGVIEAHALQQGKVIASQTLQTSGVPARLEVEAEVVSPTLADLIYFNIKVTDKDGNLVPNADIPVDIEIDGDAILQAVGNGNPIDMKSFQTPQVRTYQGKCQLIVRPDKDWAFISIIARSHALPDVDFKRTLHNSPH